MPFTENFKTNRIYNESAFDHNKFFILADDNKVIKKNCEVDKYNNFVDGLFFRMWGAPS